MRVSVVLPTYNRDYVLAEAMRSALGQTHSDLELIVVDDGSTDDTQGVVRRFRDPRVRYARHEANRGCSAAYNTGIKLAEASLIAFLDSDDFWKPDKLARETAFLEAHADAIAAFSDLEKRDGGRFFPSFMRTCPTMRQILAGRRYPDGILLPQRVVYLMLLQEVPIKPTALVVRREAITLAGGGFREDWPSGSDWELLVRLARRGDFGYIDRPLAVLRVQSDATHRTHFVRDKYLIIGMLRREERRAARDVEARRAARCGISDMSKHLGWHFLERGERMRAAAAYSRALLITGRPEFLLRSADALLPRPVSAWLRGLTACLARRAPVTGGVSDSASSHWPASGTE